MRPGTKLGLTLGITALAVLFASRVSASDRAGTVTEFALPTPNGGPKLITNGPDGNLWFTEVGSKRIGRITLGGVITDFSLPLPDGTPYGISGGPDGNVWFTEIYSNRIGRITPAGVIMEFALPKGGFPYAITSGPDGNLWIADGANRIIRLTPSGTTSEFPLIAGFTPQGIANGPDGNVWFTVFHNNIGRISPTGQITEFSLPHENGGGGPVYISAGPDGNLWFTDLQGFIGQISASGVLAQFPEVYPLDITAGADGNMWFTRPYHDSIGRITPDGAITEFPVAGPWGIASGRDGNVWFTEPDANKIGRITVAAAASGFALVVNGASGYAETPSAVDLNLTGDWTAETWFKDEDPNGFNHDYREILMKGDRNANAEAPYYVLVGSNHLLAGFRTAGRDYPVSYDLTALGLSPAAWHHVAVTFTAARNWLDLFVDGQRIYSLVVPTHSTVGNSLPVEIGRNGAATGKYWLGKLDDVRIWNVARTEDQIAANFRTQMNGPQAGLVANWHFDEGSGNTAYDSSGNHHDATLHGGATFSTDVHP